MAVEEARARLRDHGHGVLSTLHPERGVDAVPVVYALGESADGHLGEVGVPVDRVKPKSSTRLQRQANLEADPRATLLVERWEPDDWSALWWVRAELRHVADPDATTVDRLAGALAARWEPYRDRPFEHVLVLRVVALTGWSATPP